jgi:thioredoxin-related protein
MRIKTSTLLPLAALAVLLFQNFTTKAQNEAIPVMNWQSFTQVSEALKTNPKPILIFFYKAGEDSSERMMQTTFTRKEVCLYSNAKFHCVKVDISSKEDITFLDGKVYKKDPKKSYHDLAGLLLGAKPSVPSVLIYDEQNNGFSFKGYKSYYDMICEMVYIAEGVQKTTRYEVWAPAYFRTFPPDKQNNRVPLVVNWMPLKEALTRNKANPKGIFLTFYAKNSAASSVMLANAFSHNTVASYLNEHFYCVRIDAQTTDTLIWDKMYTKNGQYNDLAKTMLKDKMQFPAIFFFDGTNRLILNETSYLSPEALYILSNYVNSGSFKTMAFADFMKNFKFEFNDIVPREHQGNPPAQPGSH